MWSKIKGSAHALRHGKSNDENEDTASGDVMTGVLEQHPNLSVFNEPPPSPSKSKLAAFKRLSKGPNESIRPHSPYGGLSKKSKSNLNLNGSASQSTLTHDVTRPSHDSMRASVRSTRRPSVDMLRSLEPSLPNPPQDKSRPSTDTLPQPTTPGPTDTRFGSTRSILREPNTPGTGRNVRFFSRDALKVISPNQSGESEYPPQLQFQMEESYGNLDLDGSGRRLSPPSKSRPSVADVFSPMREEGSSSKGHARNASSSSNPFDVSGALDLPPFPPGLGFTVNEPLMEADAIFQESLAASAGNPGLTSTPFRQDKGKAKAENSMPSVPVDEAIFHQQEMRSMEIELPTPLRDAFQQHHQQQKQQQNHDRSQSFDFGQTVFYSMNNMTDGNAEAPGDVSYRSSGTSSMSVSLEAEPRPQPPRKDTDSQSSFSSRVSKSRSRALSDTIFHSMLRSPSSYKDPLASKLSEAPPPLPPKPDAPPADPFSAHATAFYTPAAMNPVTPPKTSHTRNVSKEENIILSLQTKLQLQTELCGQFEADLRARDEMVDIMKKKISRGEDEESKRKNALRVCRKKIQELERTVRYLEDEVDQSKAESMERSVMDEASSEALRMLHRQIEGLKNEQSAAARREKDLRDEIGTLENLVKERSDEVQRLSEAVWKHDESERELRDGIKDAQAQIELLGNVSVVVGAKEEEELKRLIAEKDERKEKADESRDSKQAVWDEEKAELAMRAEGVSVEKERLEEELANVKSHLETRESEYAALKAELEAQWEHTEKSTERLVEMEKEKEQVEAEKDRLAGVVEDLEQKVASLEIDWTESENRRLELENEADEIWNLKCALEKEKEELEDQVKASEKQADDLRQAHQEHETRVNTLEHEREYARSNVNRLEENIRNITSELNRADERIRERESEAESLRAEMATMSREHVRLTEEHARALVDAANHGGETQSRLETLVKEKAEADAEAKMRLERVDALKDEVDRLRRQVHELQQESADREVKVVQLNKQREKDREDLHGLNIALDSKQQELELIKRRLAVKGTAGSNPAQPSKMASHRRDSSVFSATPTVQRSRPSSVISDSDRESVAGKRLSGEVPSKVTSALLKSTRANTANGAAATPVRSSMGPPPPKARTSTVPAPSTPAPRTSSILKSSSMRPPTSTPSTTPHRRATSNLESSTSSVKKSSLLRSSSATATPTIAEKKEKENLDLSGKRRILLAQSTPV